MSRGLRNNNPGNIRLDGRIWKGEAYPSADRAFKQFISPAWGYRAMFTVLGTYRSRYGINTLRGIIMRWAPPSENDTQGYIKTVASLAGIADADATLNFSDSGLMKRIAAAMSRVENGTDAIAADVEEGWRLYKGE